MDRWVSRRLYSAPRTSGEWTSVFGSERLTGALLDRLKPCCVF
jgi:hypothetical protein